MGVPPSNRKQKLFEVDLNVAYGIDGSYEVSANAETLSRGFQRVRAKMEASVQPLYKSGELPA